jgi:modulator of FtsH protease HflK
MSDNNSFEDQQGPQMPEFKLPELNFGKLGPLILVGLVLILVLTSFYTIDPEETGLVLRFGKYMSASAPGLHFKIPFGVDQVVKVPVQRQKKEEFGFRTTSVGVNSQYSTKPFSAEANMLTGDLNAAMVEWVVQYRIKDPYLYTFKVRNVDKTFRDMSEAVMRRIVGDRTVNEVLTFGRAEVAMTAQVELQALCDHYETGIKVDQVVLQDVNPPDAVKPSFNAVNEAQQEKEKLINVAQSEYNAEIPRARGQALQAIQEAEGYSTDRVNRARGDAALFTALYEAYRKAPEITRTRMYLETMTEILPRIENTTIIDDDVRGILPMLDLNKAAAKGGK